MPVGLYAGANVSNGNGVTTLFPYNFKILDRTHIEVKVDGVVKVLGADYDVTGVGLSNGGNVVFTVAPANLAVVQRARKVPYKRDTDYQANGDLREDTLDPDLDLEEMQVQQLAADIIRAFKAPLSVTADQVLADAVWALKGLGTPYALGFDGAGTFTLLTFANPGALAVSAYIQTLLDDADAATARETLGFNGAGTGFSMVNGTLVASVAANILTVAIKTKAGADPSAADPVYVLFRNPVAGTGDYTVMKLTAATSIATAVGATFGVANNVAFRLWVVGFNDGGVFRLSLINCLSTSAGAGAGRDVTAIYPLAGWGIASSTLIGAGSNAAQTFYSAGAGVAAKAYATLGYLTYEAGLAVAGTFGVAPSRLELFSRNGPLPGQRVQLQRTATGAVATGGTSIPTDDTIPQNTEGDQYMSQAITPSSAANVLSVEAQAQLANATASEHMQVALFQDAIANALVAGNAFQTSGSSPTPNSLRHVLLAAMTVATTFKFRAGVNGAGITTFNGAAGGRRYGGVSNSYISVEEVMG